MHQLGNKRALLTGILASCLLVLSYLAPTIGRQEAYAATLGQVKTAEPKTSPYHPVGTPNSAKYYYQSVWGVDNLLVRVAASGNLVRFSYRVTNPDRAGALGDKHAKPALIDPRSRAVLQIPVLEQVGALWQAAVEMQMEKGKQYWMTFSNKGNPVKPGDRVSVVIGSFHADGLMVEE